MIILILLATGLLIGVLSAFFGVGGGIIAVPMIYTIFPNIAPQTAIASSLGMICLNSILNTYNFIKSGKKPVFNLILPIGLFMVMGVLLGGQLALHLPAKTIKILFAVILVIVALKTLFSKVSSIQNPYWKPNLTAKFLTLSAIFSLLGGIVAGLTGLGGGAILVPLFLSVLKFPISWVSVYSNAAMAIGTFAGTINYILVDAPPTTYSSEIFQKLQFGHLNLGISLCFFLGAFATSKLGIGLVKKVPAKVSKNLFAVLLLIIAIKIFITSA